MGQGERGWFFTSLERHNRWGQRNDELTVQGISLAYKRYLTRELILKNSRNSVIRCCSTDPSRGRRWRGSSARPASLICLTKSSLTDRSFTSTVRSISRAIRFLKNSMLKAICTSMSNWSNRDEGLREKGLHLDYQCWDCSVHSSVIAETWLVNLEEGPGREVDEHQRH